MNDRQNRVPLDADWLSHLRTAVVLVRADLTVDWMNPSAEDLLGAPGLVAEGLRASGLDEIIRRAGAEQRVVAVQDVEWLRHGAEACLDVEVVPLPDGRFLLELHDAAPRRRAQADRDRHDRQDLSRRVVRQLAHEIRNPLAGLRGAAQLLGRDQSGEARRELTGIILGEVDRLGRLVDELLVPTGFAQLTRANVHEPVDRLYGLLRAEGGERITVTRDYDPSLPEVDLDADALARALLNLGRNALQAGATELRLVTRVKRRVTWEGRLHRLAVAVEVVDDGPGVPPELADSLFFPLVTGRDDGSGLGLSIAQEIADRHGGRIEFESRPGHTVFRLLLPVPA
ncbi:MAG: nitrogen regulation protein NR(II) [Candidatus Wenzhouxiangella sp. M2_3B_020]